MKRLSLLLYFFSFLFAVQGHAQSGRNCSNAITVNLNSNWTRLGTDQFNGPNPKFWKFTASDCGYLYICGTGDIAKDCSNGPYEPVNATFSCSNNNQRSAYKLERGKRYYISVSAGFAGSFADFSFITDKNACDQGCQHIPSNCSQVVCTPQTPTGNGSSYRCNISASYNGNDRIAYWEVDGQRVNSSSKSRTFTVRKSGTILVCCYYYCNGQTYKCCREVYCPPVDNCICTKEYNPVCGADGKEYSNSCVAECAGVSWTHGPCQDHGGGGCGGYCDEDDFSRYSTGKKIGQQSSKWRTWDRGKEGSSQDAWVSTASTGRHILKLERNNDVVYNLGNKRSGTHCLATRLWVKNNQTAYYNIQADYSRNVGGGYWSVTFKNGTARLGNTSYSFRYTSNKWMKIYMKFHLDSKTIDFICEQDGRVIGRKSLRYNNRIYLGGLNFYGIDYAEYYCDYIQVNCDSGGYFADSGSRANSDKIDVVSDEMMSKNKLKKPPFNPNTKDSPKPNASQQKTTGPIE